MSDKSFLGNDDYEAQINMTWVANPPATTIQVSSVPVNFPTIITAGLNQNNQTKFAVEGYSGDSPANYTLTGVTVLTGGQENLPSGTTLNCVVHEDFLNQYAKIINGQLITLGEQNNDPDTPASGKVIFYMKNGVPFVKDDAGTVTQIGYSSDEWITRPDAGTINFDMSEPVKKLKFLVGPLAGNRTFTLTGLSEGKIIMVRVMQDGTANRQPKWFASYSEQVTITIASPGVITTTKDIRTGVPVKFTTSGALPTGIVENTQYYWIRVGSTTGRLATTKANALAGTALNTSGSQSGDHTMAIQVIWAEYDQPTCSNQKWDYDDFAFVAQNDYILTGVKMAGEY